MTSTSSQPYLHKLGDHSADKRMLLLATAALFVGSGGAFGAWVLLKLIALATNLFWFGRLSAQPAEIADSLVGTGVVFIPVIGSVIVGLMARFGSDKIRGHGIPEAIEAILYGESRLSPKVALLKPLSSAISIGSGGPFGAEGPIIMTGGAIGSLFAQCFHLSAAERKTLLVAGAAAGMTAIFGTPVAAILLAIEVLLFEWKPRSLVPVVVAALVSLAWRPLLIGSGPLFPFADAPVTNWAVMLGAGAIGLAIGLQAVVLSNLLYWIEDQFHRLPIHWMWWPALGAVVVGLGGLIDRHALGAGYQSIQQLLDGSLTARLILTLVVVKAVVWLVALSSGTSGGVLAPLLILGGACAALVGMACGADPGFCAMLGMAAILSGAMRAPLTGAVFVVELTGHFESLGATFAASAAAYAVSVLLMRRSILTEKISRRGRHVLQEYVIDPFDFLRAGDIMTRNPDTLSGSTTLARTIQFFANGARHRSYPVVDEDGRLLGLASRSDALRWRVDNRPTEATLADVVSDASQPSAGSHVPVGYVADLMVQTNIGRIPIIDPASQKVVGILSRHDLLKARQLGVAAERARSR